MTSDQSRLNYRVSLPSPQQTREWTIRILPNYNQLRLLSRRNEEACTSSQSFAHSTACLRCPMIVRRAAQCTWDKVQALAGRGGEQRNKFAPAMLRCRHRGAATTCMTTQLGRAAETLCSLHFIRNTTKQVSVKATAAVHSSCFAASLGRAAKNAVLQPNTV
jgi:hypothetical protein